MEKKFFDIQVMRWSLSKVREKHPLSFSFPLEIPSSIRIEILAYHHCKEDFLGLSFRWGLWKTQGFSNGWPFGAQVILSIRDNTLVFKEK